jgi:hypothetical protein
MNKEIVKWKKEIKEALLDKTTNSSFEQIKQLANHLNKDINSIVQNLDHEWFLQLVWERMNLVGKVKKKFCVEINGKEVKHDGGNKELCETTLNKFSKIELDKFEQLYSDNKLIISKNQYLQLDKVKQKDFRKMNNDKYFDVTFKGQNPVSNFAKFIRLLNEASKSKVELKEKNEISYIKL